ncbi:MAG: hypothetical protein U0936_18615 [Planctomycetaceae bacterium]
MAAIGTLSQSSNDATSAAKFPSFDEVYVTSASVMSACYFITKTSLLGMSVYFENCPTWSFINPARFWKVLNVDYIVDQIAANDKPINSELLTNSRTHLLFSVCNRQTGEVFLADTRTAKTPLL